MNRVTASTGSFPSTLKAISEIRRGGSLGIGVAVGVVVGVLVGLGGSVGVGVGGVVDVGRGVTVAGTDVAINAVASSSGASLIVSGP